MSLSDGEKRKRPRQRTRLRSGKLADGNGTFLCECTIHDRSPGGVRLRLSAAIPLPDTVLLYDDERRDLLAANVVWRRGQELGVELSPAPNPRRTIRIAARLSSKYYAIQSIGKPR